MKAGPPGCLAEGLRTRDGNPARRQARSPKRTSDFARSDEQPRGVLWLARGQAFGDDQLGPVVGLDGEPQSLHVREPAVSERLAASGDTAHLDQALNPAG